MSLDITNAKRLNLTNGIIRTNSEKEPEELEVIDITIDEISEHFPQTVILDPRQLDQAVIGLCVSEPVPVAVYDFEEADDLLDGVILGYTEEELYVDHDTALDVIEFLQYNTIRACAYTPNSPIIWENEGGDF